MKKTIIICGYPGVGKSYYEEHFKSENNIILDSDSSLFSWIYDKNLNKTNKRNPTFPNNYIDHIKLNIGSADIIFVSTHKEVISALIENKIRFCIVKPVHTEQMKEIYLNKYVKRNNTPEFIKLMKDKWDDFHQDLSDVSLKHDIPIFYLNVEHPHLDSYIMKLIKSYYIK